MLGAVEGDKVHLVAGVTKDLTATLKAGDLIRPVAELVGGRGGGRADFAQAGGNKPEKPSTRRSRSWPASFRPRLSARVCFPSRA